MPLLLGMAGTAATAPPACLPRLEMHLQYEAAVTGALTVFVYLLRMNTFWHGPGGLGLYGCG